MLQKLFQVKLWAYLLIFFMAAERFIISLIVILSQYGLISGIRATKKAADFYLNPVYSVRHQHAGSAAQFYVRIVFLLRKHLKGHKRHFLKDFQ